MKVRPAKDESGKPKWVSEYLSPNVEKWVSRRGNRATIDGTLTS
jgi:hypothetical protein